MNKAEHLLDRMELKEASIGRIMNSLKRDFTLITVFRKSDNIATNRAKNKEMLQKFFRPMGVGGTAIKGKWPEKQLDGSIVYLEEESFLIQRPDSVTPEEFKATVIAAMKTYNQDAVVLGIGGSVGVIYQDGRFKKIADQAKIKDGDLQKAYSQYRGHKIQFETFKPRNFAQALEADHYGLEY